MWTNFQEFQGFTGKSAKICIREIRLVILSMKLNQYMSELASVRINPRENVSNKNLILRKQTAAKFNVLRQFM